MMKRNRRKKTKKNQIKKTKRPLIARKQAKNQRNQIRIKNQNQRTLLLIKVTRGAPQGLVALKVKGHLKMKIQEAVIEADHVRIQIVIMMNVQIQDLGPHLDQ